MKCPDQNANSIHPLSSRGVYQPRSYGGGFYRPFVPGLFLWGFFPIWYYPGYHHKYERYNSDNAFFYVREFQTPSQPNATTGWVDTVQSTEKEHNRLRFLVTTEGGGFPRMRATYFDTSNPEVVMADFTFGLTLYKLVEFADVDGGGAFDSGDRVLSEWPLNRTWTPITFSNLTDPIGLNYFQTELSAADGATSVRLRMRIANTKLRFQEYGNMTTEVLPNTLKYDLVVANYPFSATDSRLALVSVFHSQVITLLDPIVPNDTNVTKGVSTGMQSEGRWDWVRTAQWANLPAAGNFSSLANNPAGAPGPSPVNQTVATTELGAQYLPQALALSAAETTLLGESSENFTVVAHTLGSQADVRTQLGGQAPNSIVWDPFLYLDSDVLATSSAPKGVAPRGLGWMLCVVAGMLLSTL
ncbi:uncharacterized protein VTP21DRAFT_10859 [Calcarisporiella thermophila]|uniref:uncharacterized protein n=1 Tax=Calcarisporiella thermophila TaxID=911321 RepID=UPI003743BD4E